MDTFLDTCIILSRFNDQDKYYERICIFLDDPGSKIISKYQEQEEIPNLFRRKKRVINEALQFFKDRKYLVNYEGLTNKEQAILRSLVSKINFNKETEENLREKLREIINWETKVNFYVQSKISRKVVPVLDINMDLVMLIKKINQNSADAKIIASAIQEHQKDNLIAFTLDNRDWKINSIKQEIQDMNYACPETRFLR
jgi:glutaredoxin-related protein